MMRAMPRLTAEWSYRMACIFLGFFGSLLVMDSRTSRESSGGYLSPSFVLLNQSWYRRATERAIGGGSVCPNEQKFTIGERIAHIRHHERVASMELLHSTRILCMVLTRPDERGIKQRQAVMDTWGKRCYRLVFLLGNDSHTVAHLSANVSVVSFKFKDAMDQTWRKVRLGIEYVHRVYRGQFDWFMRIDDDGFVIMENLLLFLKKRDPTAHEMYGVHYKTYDGYVGTGAGLTMSAHNFERLRTSIDMPGCTKRDTHFDDVEIARCLKLVDIHVTDSRDERERFRFFPMPPEGTMYHKGNPDWLWKWLAYNIREGFECCSDEFVAFHYISAEQMHVLEMLIYYVHPFSRRETWQPDWTPKPQLATPQPATSSSIGLGLSTSTTTTTSLPRQSQ